MGILVILIREGPGPKDYARKPKWPNFVLLQKRIRAHVYGRQYDIRGVLRTEVYLVHHQGLGLKEAERTVIELQAACWMNVEG